MVLPAASGGARPPAYGPVAYRWVVLAVVMAANAALQSLWIGYAPMTEAAQAYYGVDETRIGLFAMVFMLAFIPLSLPASWLIDVRGARFAVTAGAVLAATGGVWRGLAGPDWGTAFAATALIATAQPLLLNAWTSIAAVWFAQRQRAGAVSFMTLASLIGTAVALLVTPNLARALGVAGAQLVYGVTMALAALLVVGFMRSAPHRPPDRDADRERAVMLDGLRGALRNRPFRLLLAATVVVVGAFNGVATWIEKIVAPRGLSSADAGIIGAAMLVAGVAGAVVLGAASDRQLRRVRYLLLGMLGGAPGLVGMAFGRSLPELIGAAMVTGFFLVGAVPVGMQYGAEITRPTPEGTSNGLLQLAGQASVVVVGFMVVARAGEGSFTPSLLLLAATLVVLAVVAARRLPEPLHSPLDAAT